MPIQDSPHRAPHPLVFTILIIPFGAVVVMLFAFALDSDQTLLHAAAPGLFWAAVLLAVLLAVGRSFSIEEAEATVSPLRSSVTWA